MTIKVTQEHINMGRHGSFHSCPIALALEQTGVHCAVMPSTVWAGGTRYNLPSEATTFIRRFDNRLHVEPFEFTISELHSEG